MKSTAHKLQPRKDRGVAGAGQWTSNRLPAGESDALFHDVATKINDRADRSAYVHGLDPQDLRQDVWEHYLKQARSHNAKADAQSCGAPGQHAAGNQRSYGELMSYVNTTVHGVVQRHLTRLERSEDRKALKQFLERVRQIEQSGQSVSEDERDDIAQRIRMSYPPGRRPTAGFHASQRVDSLDAHIDRDDAHEPAMTGLHGPSAETDFRLGSSGDEALSAMEDHAGNGRHEATTRLWNALADARDAPKVTPAQLGWREAQKLRETIETAGGVDKVVDSWWQDGDTADTDALFGPFGGAEHLDDDHKRRVLDVIETAPYGKGAQVWDSAVVAATSSRGLAKHGTAVNEPQISDRGFSQITSEGGEVPL